MEKIKVNGYELDEEQMKVVLDDSKYLLVSAGAGSGKTLTILGKIKYLTNNGYRPKDILCISFTKEAVKSLKEKLKNMDCDCDVYTFHKLSLEILNYNGIKYEICSSDFLEYVIDEYFDTLIFENKRMIRYVLKYFKKKDYYSLQGTKEFIGFKRLISTFIHLFESSGYSLDKFIFFEKSLFLPRSKYLLRIILNTFIFYQNELNSSNKIDFDIMITLATKVLKSGSFKHYKYIIIDEYQDTSYIRYLLIKELINKYNSKLLSVGDDFQSIYRFTGCDLNMFLKFNEYFKESKLLKLQNTYRNSQELITVAGKFIMKNKFQIKKDLKSNQSLSKPIKIVYLSNKEKLKNLIDQNTLILGRTNNDIYDYLSKEYIENNNINYMTIHRSKGLEEDKVILINMVKDIFPSSIKDDRILKLVTRSKDKYLYEEERRLFYVAITRTKGFVYIITVKGKESIFVKEIIKDSKNFIEIIKL